jgi:hypothetical protein
MEAYSTNKGKGRTMLKLARNQNKTANNYVVDIII